MKKLNKIYLAIPYSKMDGELSFNLANEVMISLLNAGHNVFSPITHTHPLVRLGVRGDWKFWKQVDLEFIDWTDEMVVIIPPDTDKITGIELLETSVGVQAEIKYCKEQGKDVKYFDYNTKIFIKIPELVSEE